MKFSIRKRLLWAMLTTLLILSASASTVTYMRARSDVNDLFDYEMRQMVFALAIHISSHPNLAEEPLLRIEHDFVTQVWSKNGELLFSSRSGAGPVAPLRPGFSDFGGTKGWRTFTMEGGNYILQAAQPQALRRKLAADVALNAMLPIIAIVPIGGVLVWALLGYGLSPLRVIAREIESRDPTILKPLSFPKQPSEITPLVCSLNDLLGRLDHALKAERQFIADASHELRTPITALQLQVDLLETATNDKERAELICDIKEGVGRTRRLIEQILTMARLDPDYSSDIQQIQLDAFIKEIHEEFLALASAKSIHFVVKSMSSATVRGESASLRALLRNLIDNALRYTPAHGTVTIGMENNRTGSQLTISDSGPGIPQDMRGKVFARFYRGDNVSEATGTGLGLAIAKRAAERLSAQLQLQDGPDGKGLTALISFQKLAGDAQAAVTG